MPLRHSKQTLRFLLLMLGLVLQSGISQELDITQVTKLKELVESKQFDEAYEVSNSLIADWGGDPGFDLLAGQAAYGAGHFQEAVFSFERVLIVSPDVLLARL